MKTETTQMEPIDVLSDALDFWYIEIQLGKD